jgi:hypothetical protein
MRFMSSQHIDSTIIDCRVMKMGVEPEEGKRNRGDLFCAAIVPAGIYTSTLNTPFAVYDFHNANRQVPNTILSI